MTAFYFSQFFWWKESNPSSSGFVKTHVAPLKRSKNHTWVLCNSLQFIQMRLFDHESLRIVFSFLLYLLVSKRWIEFFSDFYMELGRIIWQKWFSSAWGVRKTKNYENRQNKQNNAHISVCVLCIISTIERPRWFKKLRLALYKLKSTKKAEKCWTGSYILVQCWHEKETGIYRNQTAM